MKRMIPVLGVTIALIVLALLFSFIGLANLSIINQDITLDEPGSIGWWIGSCNDDSNECEQLQKVTFTNTVYVSDDWQLVCDKRDLCSVFDYCLPITEKRPTELQSTYHDGDFVTYDRCVLDYKLTTTIDKNGCTIKTWTWYDGVKKQVSGCWRNGDCCYHKDELIYSYYPSDNDEAGTKSHSSGGSEYRTIWNCYQNINIYYKNEFVDKVEQPHDFIIDMDNKIVYDNYDTILVDNSYDFMRVRKIKHKYTGEPYYDCNYIMNEVIWSQRQCLVDLDCNDNDPYTLHDLCSNYQCNISQLVQCLNDSDCDDSNEFTLTDSCIDYQCINSEPVDCLNDSDCEYYEECIDNNCITKYDFLDNDGDRVVNKFDECINTYGSKINGCPTLFEQIMTFLKVLFDSIFRFFQ